MWHPALSCVESYANVYVYATYMQENDDNNKCNARFLLLQALFASDGFALAAKNNL